ncbi:type II toxin-antitoxin system HicA family toxin [Salinicoccus halodurans]|uniref:Predicted RNA binding protein YcfA, dsRBD-like fold, HicA-like mRNA interferase family n=1 Tax=Salinicoccus halodurans TaxID=407035 RepID=A0A0F7HKZ5_9STAP|nr:type II toxin-antitoxin system HicA family toxin [Salinicoccus halodurans]AKG74191.1 hypothetical protein AAT16_08060 [Salinicoccus halodurans]SFK92861.1 Predicted RNA binding protein YcfA, dsRBD-like fold, HicA-like mRNA interferase family [Salinicoccus halodurans]
MAGVDKIVDKMKRQPNNISFPEAKKVLEKYGYEEKRSKGSHHIFKNPDTKDRMPLPRQSPLKPYLVRDVLKRIGEE